nr:PepSY domain-containing protein [uncultured Oscillibacter sp.]
MRDQELERRLRTAVEHAAPDPLERILASCGTQKGTVIPMTNNKKKRWAPLAAAAVLAVLLCGGFGLHGWQTAHAVASVVSLDVNPSIQLQVNQKETVLSAQALNQDAQVILEGMDLRNTQLNVAVNAIVGSLLQHGYLDRLSSAILISVEDSDAQRAARLETALTAEVDAALQNASAGAAVLSQVLTYDAGLEPQAQANSISVGKAAMIQRVRSLNGDLAFEDLAALSVEELKQLWETGAPGLPIGRDAAAYAAQAYAGLLEVDAVTWDVDPELDEYPAHYEVELRTAAGEFDYDVDAYSGQVLKGPADALTATASGGATAAQPGASSAIITEARARAIALEHAGVQEADALGLRVKLDREDGVQVYDVEFRAGSIEYEYELRSSDGAILKAERDRDDHWYVSASSAGGTAQAAYIGEAAAKRAALAHAGVQESDTSYIHCWLEYDDGRAEYYEVEFQADSTQYGYEIGLYDGSVLKSERETFGAAAPQTGGAQTGGAQTGGAQAGGSYIGEEAAKSAAFNHAGVSAADASRLKCELDVEKGVYVYEVEFEVGRTEYEYEIDAVSGAILKAEQDID